MCIEYLDLVVLENKISIDSVKVTGVWEWPILESQTNVQAFLGFVDFYRYFIQDFSAIAQLLFDLICSDWTWKWGDKEWAAFEALKMAVTSTPVLVSPHNLEPFWIEVDSLDYTTDALDRSQEFGILYNYQKAKPLASILVPLPGKI